jgi:hypothetical protein
MFGVGPEMISHQRGQEPTVYERYRASYSRSRQPDQSAPPQRADQIAAERGLPALAAWLWFLVVAALGVVAADARARVAGCRGRGISALIAMVAAGMLEYNFGDSEFLMLFLGLITLPYAAARSESSDRGQRALRRTAAAIRQQEDIGRRLAAHDVAPLRQKL